MTTQQLANRERGLKAAATRRIRRQRDAQRPSIALLQRVSDGAYYQSGFGWQLTWTPAACDAVKFKLGRAVQAKQQLALRGIAVDVVVL
jgi:hypothetical protein